MSTTEPVDGKGDTTNPTKSPCDPFIFNTVLTRSKSLVVVVGSPLALFGIEKHMKELYGKRASCWSSYIRLCLENDTFIIPSEVEPSEVKRLEFNLRLKARLFDGGEVSQIASLLADSLQHSKQRVAPMQGISQPDSRRHVLPPTSHISIRSEQVASKQQDLFASSKQQRLHPIASPAVSHTAIIASSPHRVQVSPKPRTVPLKQPSHNKVWNNVPPQPTLPPTPVFRPHHVQVSPKPKPVPLKQPPQPALPPTPRKQQQRHGEQDRIHAVCKYMSVHASEWHHLLIINSKTIKGNGYSRPK